MLPPGDLRMALAALCGDDEWGRTWSDVLQHRFRSDGELHEPRGRQPADRRAVGAARTTRSSGLDWVAGCSARRAGCCRWRRCRWTSRPRCVGRRPGAPDELARGARPGRGGDDRRRVVGVRLLPDEPAGLPARPWRRSLAADWVVLGPGSWFTSVLPHLLVPELAAALRTTPARRLLVLNLSAQPGETDGFTPAEHLEVLAAHAPDLRARRRAGRPRRRRPTARPSRSRRRLLGAELVLADAGRVTTTPTSTTPTVWRPLCVSLFGTCPAPE